MNVTLDSFYHMTVKLLLIAFLRVKNAKILPYICDIIMDVITQRYRNL